MADSVENTEAYKTALAEIEAAQEKGENKYFFTSDDNLVRWVESHPWAQQIYRYSTSEWVDYAGNVQDDGQPIDSATAERIMGATDYASARQLFSKQG